MLITKTAILIAHETGIVISDDKEGIPNAHITYVFLILNYIQACMFF